LACTPIFNSDSIKDNFCLVLRGSCTFAEKILQCEQAGAKAAIIINNQATALFVMAPNPDIRVSIPSVLISLDDGNEILEHLSIGVLNEVSLFATQEYSINEVKPNSHEPHSLTRNLNDGSMLVTLNAPLHVFFTDDYLKQWVNEEIQNMGIFITQSGTVINANLAKKP